MHKSFVTNENAKLMFHRADMSWLATQASPASPTSGPSPMHPPRPAPQAAAARVLCPRQLLADTLAAALLVRRLLADVPVARNLSHACSQLPTSLLRKLVAWQGVAARTTAMGTATLACLRPQVVAVLKPGLRALSHIFLWTSALTTAACLR